MYASYAAAWLVPARSPLTPVHAPGICPGPRLSRVGRLQGDQLWATKKPGARRGFLAVPAPP